MIRALISLSPPPFTEEWAQTYLQVLFSSFIFAVGVPAAIHSEIDSDIKHLSQTRSRVSRYFLSTVFLYVIVLTTILLIPPDASPPIGVTRQLSGTQFIKALVPMLSVTVLPLAVLGFGLWLNYQFRREKTVLRLRQQLLKQFRSVGYFDDAAVHDLTVLGGYGRTGAEKDLVLDVIDELAQTIQTEIREQKLSYNGHELESLIRHIPWMLDNRFQPGDDENYRRASEVLANIWRWVRQERVTHDALSTREALRRLALQSVQLTAEEIVLGYLEIAADCDSHMVFDIGVAAIEMKKYMLAVAALTKLEAMANAISDDHSREATAETIANTLGMAAHLAAQGLSGAIRAKTTLEMNHELFVPSLKEALENASGYHYSAGRFDISDEISLFTKGAVSNQS